MLRWQGRILKIKEKKERKFVVIGKSRVGKTTWVNNLLGKVRDLDPTIGVEVSQIEASTDKETYKVSLWDCGGEFSGLKEKYWENADGGIVMFDLGDVDSYETAKILRERLRCPSVLCGNKCDLERAVFSTMGDPECYEISAKYGYRLLSPITGLLSKIENSKLRKI